MTMKLKFTIPYRAHWGEMLQVAVTFLAQDGYQYHEKVNMNTKDGYEWVCETMALQSRSHPYRFLAYYYQVVDGDGHVMRRESAEVPRAYVYDAGKNYTFADFWLVGSEEEELLQRRALERIKDVEHRDALDVSDEVKEEQTTNSVAQWAVQEIPSLPLYDRTVIFKVAAPLLREGEAVALLGNHPTLGNWNTDRYLRMLPTGDGGWVLSVSVVAIDGPLEYKYVVIDEKTQKFKRWEEGANRHIGGARIYDQDVYVLHGGCFRVKPMPAHAQFNFDTYIFDLDGTLLSTLTDLAASCNYALAHNGMPERTIDEVRRFVGNGVKKLMERAIPGGEANPRFEQTFADFRQHYMHHNLDTTCPYPGVMEMLSELKARGKAIAVVSNKFYSATQALCQHFFGDLVDVAIGEREDIRKKPAPDTVNEALRQLGADRHKAVYIGDSDVDVMTGRNSGMPCISVLWGFRDRDFLIRHDATIFVSSPLQIL